MAGVELQDLLMKNWFPWVALLLVWGLIIVVINPRGEFMVNDDWSFVRSLEAFRSTGNITVTGWGPPGAPSGPALLVHLLLGDLFSRIFGFSLTNLRIAVLTMGILGSFGLMLLLRIAKVSPWLALLGTLTVVGNPLFLSECFTYMTDVTFASLAIFAVLLLYLGVKKSSLAWIIAGLLLVLASILTRQIGVVILLAFLVTCWVHPIGTVLGRAKIFFLGLALVILPWITYEALLSHLGSSPLTQHQVIHNIFTFPREKGFLDYLFFIFSSLFFFALGYLGFFVSPLLTGKLILFWRSRYFRYLLLVFAILVVLFEIAILTDLLHPPMIFLGNIIYNFGIGPILLKDTYILGIPRLAVISRAAYYLLVSWAALALGVILTLFLAYVRQWLQTRFAREDQDNAFLLSLVFLAALFYLGIITLTYFHDRYLIPALIFLVIWLSIDRSASLGGAETFWKIIPGFVMVICLGVWSTCQVHDFMEMKRGQKKAHDYALQRLQVNPCFMDGGFEFNGYYCYRNDFQPPEGLSWWWVSREDYLITLGPLPGYRVIQVFPFQRYCGPPGAIHLLQALRPDIPKG
jgi:hypothetical protein